jgi:FAD-linked sulfhydryl oxidase
MVALIRSPYFDPWTRRLFGEGGLEGNLHPKLDPPAHIGGVTGGVIMSKLGNATAKYAENHPLWSYFTYFN